MDNYWRYFKRSYWAYKLFFDFETYKASIMTRLFLKSLTLILAFLIAFWSCKKEEVEYVPLKIIEFSVSPDSVETGGFVEIHFEFDRGSESGMVSGWKKDAGEYLYEYSLGSHPSFWKAPDIPGNYNLSVHLASGEVDTTAVQTVYVY